MPENTTSEEATLVAAAEKLTQCDGYIVLAVDPQTGEVDAHGPFDGLMATVKADQLRRDFDRGGLEDVTVGVVRLHSPPERSARDAPPRRVLASADPAAARPDDRHRSPNGAPPARRPGRTSATRTVDVRDHDRPCAAAEGHARRRRDSDPAAVAARPTDVTGRRRPPPATAGRARRRGRDEAGLRRFLHGLPGVDQVGLERRSAVLATRSIKAASKLHALDLAISMIDLTTLEGADTPGKVRSLCAPGPPPRPGPPGRAAGRRGLHLSGPGRGRRRGAARVARWRWPRWPPRSRPAGPRARSSWPTPRSPSRPGPARSTW